MHKDCFSCYPACNRRRNKPWGRSRAGRTPGSPPFAAALPALLLCFGPVADLGWLTLLSLCFCLNWCRWLDRVCFWLVADLGWWPNWHSWCRWLDGLCCWLCCLCLQLGNLPQQILLLLLPLLLFRRLVCLPPCPLHLVPLLAPLLCLEGLLRI